MIRIKGTVGVVHTHTGTNGDFEYTLDDLNITEEEWLSWDDKQRQEVLDDVLCEEISNVLDASVWVEGE